ncbi:MAG TPA: hypothetical protein VF989_03695 [Polyangiaceae bacterium]|jgi:hypothetical protein
MAIFDRLSRYAKPALPTEHTIDIRGREVRYLPTPEPPREVSVGIHLKKQRENLDQLAAAYLQDPHAYWRFLELNDAVVPDALAEREQIDVPAPIR